MKPTIIWVRGLNIPIYNLPNPRSQWREIVRRQGNFDYVRRGVLTEELLDNCRARVKILSLERQRCRVCRHSSITSSSRETFS